MTAALPQAVPHVGPTVDPAAKPYFSKGADGGIGIVLVHGLTASPTEVKPIATYLQHHEPGFTLSCPLLPGHGTCVEDLRRTDPGDWRRTVAAEVDRVDSICGATALVGVSLGAVLAATVALDDPRVRSLVMLSPTFTLRAHTAIALHLLRYFRRFAGKSRRSLENHRAKGLFSYDRYPVNSLLHLQALARTTRARLRNLSVPTLIAGGRRDRYLPWSAVEALCHAVGSSVVELVECADSGHVLPHEPDAPQLMQRIHRFLRQAHGLTRQPQQPSGRPDPGNG